MKCILCDRCNKIIMDIAQHRVLTCARPLKRRNGDDKRPYRGDDKTMNDIIWEKDLCMDCAAEFEKAAQPTDTAENGGDDDSGQGL